MKTATFILFGFLLSSCAASETAKVEKQTTLQKIRARITYYYPQAPFWKKVACTKSRFAKEGITVAAHPDFKFGTRVYIPGLKGKVGDGNFIVQDRGSAVTKKRASRGKGYVFDIYVDNRNEMCKLHMKTPEWLDVFVEK